MGSQLMLRIAGVYIAVLFFGTLILVFNNKVVYGVTLKEQLNFVVKAILVGDLFILLLLMLFTFIRLRKVIRYVHLENGSERLQILQRLLSFPYELFWGMMAISLLFSGLFHVAHWLVKEKRELNQEYWVELLHTIISEQLLALTLAMLLYSVLRKLLRPHIANLKITSIEGLRHSSMVNPLLITFSSLLLLILWNMYRYVVYTLDDGSELKLGTLVLIASTYFSFGFLLFLWHLLEIKEHIRHTTEGIRSLLGGDRQNMHTPMLVLANDEVGQLTTIFNQLQQKISKDYADLEKEKLVATIVQQKLLRSNIKLHDVQMPVPNPSIQEQSTLFYDLINNDKQELFLKGTISSQGMPAAIIMSAILVLFRTEIQRKHNPQKILTDIQEMLTELVKEVEISVSLVISEKRNGL